jgi:hypothetical protein
MGAAAAAGLIEVGKTNDDAPRRGMTVVEIENLPPTTEPCELLHTVTHKMVQFQFSR